MPNYALQYTLDLSQRWCEGRASYRPPSETISPSEFEVAEIPDDTTARDFVIRHHYAGSFPAARVRVGLYRHGNLSGVAVFSHPASDAVLENVFHVPARQTIELGRFVLLDSVEANGETWFLRRCFAILRKQDIRGVLSFSDPQPRRTVSGDIVHIGHTGIIYQAFSGKYLGRGTARTLRLLPDGRVFSDRAAQKIRAGEQGWRYAASQLERFGIGAAPEDPEARRIWLRTATELLTTPVRHRGNHKYAWALDKSLRSSIQASFPYPKTLDPLATCQMAA
jgi:hypothetical protein